MSLAVGAPSTESVLMKEKRGPVTPSPLTIAEALRGSAPLARLKASLADSNARFEQIRAILPAPLCEHVKPGPVDAEGWSLLASNAAVAAKLRQLRPRLEDRLRAAGWPSTTVRIKVSKS